MKRLSPVWLEQMTVDPFYIQYLKKKKMPALNFRTEELLFPCFNRFCGDYMTFFSQNHPFRLSTIKMSVNVSQLTNLQPCDFYLKCAELCSPARYQRTPRGFGTLAKCCISQSFRGTLIAVAKHTNRDLFQSSQSQIRQAGSPAGMKRVCTGQKVQTFASLSVKSSMIASIFSSGPYQQEAAGRPWRQRGVFVLSSSW